MPQESKQDNPRPRPRRSAAFTLLILVLSLPLFAACSDNPQEALNPIAPIASPTASPEEERVPENPATSPTPAAQPPTEPPPTATPSSAESAAPEELAEVQGAFRLIVVTQLLADSLNQAALDAESGAQNSLETQVTLRLAGVISTGITGARSDLTPPEPMASYSDEAQSINLALDALTTAWQDEELTAAEVIVAIEPLMIDLARLSEDAERAMTGQWQIAPAAISQLRQDIIAEVTQILSDLRSPPTPPTAG